VKAITVRTASPLVSVEADPVSKRARLVRSTMTTTALSSECEAELADRAKYRAACEATLDPCEDTSLPPDSEGTEGRYGSRLHFWNLTERRVEQTLELGQAGLVPLYPVTTTYEGRLIRHDVRCP